MKRLSCSILLGIFLLSGCAHSPDAASSPERMPPTSAEAPAQSGSVGGDDGGNRVKAGVAAPADPAVEAPGGTAAADPAAAGATGLAGTKWQLGEYVVDFKDDGKVLVKGGQIATLMPDGAEGEYKVEDGKFSVSVLGQSFNGTWDGSKLVVDGNEAVPQ